VAQLRQVLGISAAEFARLVGRSFHTINSVESGRLSLSEELATRISHETNAELGWLLDAAQTGPPVNRSGELLTREEFERHLASASELSKDPLAIETLLEQFRRLLSFAQKHKEEEFPRLIWRVNKFEEELERELHPETFELMRIQQQILARTRGTVERTELKSKRLSHTPSFEEISKMISEKLKKSARSKKPRRPKKP
jgi:transcriptional regulator with XRE-family HTH domain